MEINCDKEYKHIFDRNYEIVTESCLNIKITCKLYKDHIAEIFDIDFAYDSNITERERLMSFCVCIRNVAEKLQEKSYTNVLRLVFRDDFEMFKTNTTWSIVDDHNCNVNNCMYDKTLLISCNISNLIDNIALEFNLL